MTETQAGPEDPALATQRPDASGRARSNASGATRRDASLAGRPTDQLLPTPQAPLDNLGAREQAPPCPFGGAVDAGSVESSARPTRVPYRHDAPPYRLVQPHAPLEGSSGRPAYRSHHFGVGPPGEQDRPTSMRPGHHGLPHGLPGPFYRPAYPHLQGGGNPFSFDPNAVPEPQYRRGYGAPYPVGIARQPLGHRPGGVVHDPMNQDSRPLSSTACRSSPSPPPPSQFSLLASRPAATPPPTLRPGPIETPERLICSDNNEFAELVADLSPNSLLKLTSDGGGNYEAEMEPEFSPPATSQAHPDLTAPPAAAQTSSEPSALPRPPPSPAALRWPHVPKRITKSDLSKFEWDEEGDEDAAGAQPSQDPATPKRRTLAQQLFSSATPKAHRGPPSSVARSRSLEPAETPKMTAGKKRAASELPDLAEKDEEDGYQSELASPSPLKRVGTTSRFKVRKLPVVISDEDDGESGEEEIREDDNDGSEEGGGEAKEGGKGKEGGEEAKEGDKGKEGNEEEEEEGEEEEEEEEKGQGSVEGDICYKVGRPTKEDAEIADAGILVIQKMINDLAAKLNRPPNFVCRRLNTLFAPGSRIILGITDWSMYVGYFWRHERQRLGLPNATPTKAYFKNFKETFPETWLELIETDYTISHSKVHSNLGERAKAFRKFSDDVVGLINVAEKMKFEALFVACGSVVNEDGNLGAFHRTKHLQGLVESRLRHGMTADSFLGQVKSHSFHTHSSEYVDNDNNSNGNEVENQAAGPSNSAQAAPSSNSTHQSAAAIPPSLANNALLKRAQATNDAEVIELAIKLLSMAPSEVDSNALKKSRECVREWTELNFRLLGKSTGRKTLAWGKNHRNSFGKAGIAVRNWPQDVVMLGEGDGSQGIRAVVLADIREIIRTLAKQGVEWVKVDATELQENKIPMVEEGPPPPGHSQKRGRRMFVDGTIDFRGPRRLQGPSSSRAPAPEKGLAVQSSSKQGAHSEPASAPSKKKSASKNAPAEPSLPAPSRPFTRSTTSSKSKSKSRVDDSDDSRPLAPNPDRSSKVERIPLPNKRKVEFVDDSEDEQFESPSEDEPDSPRRRPHRSGSASAEDDLFVSSPRDSSDEGSTAERSLPLAGKGGSKKAKTPATATASGPSKSSSSKTASSTKTTSSIASTSATQVTAAKAAAVKTASSEAVALKAAPTASAPAKKSTSGKAATTGSTAKNASTKAPPSAVSFPENSSHRGVPRPRPRHHIASSSGLSSRELDERFVLQRKRKSDSEPDKLQPEAHKGDSNDPREKRARVEDDVQRLNLPPASNAGRGVSPAPLQSLRQPPLDYLPRGHPPPHRRQLHGLHVPPQVSSNAPPRNMAPSYLHPSSYSEAQMQPPFVHPHHPSHQQQQQQQQQPQYYPPHAYSSSNNYFNYNDYAYPFDYGYNAEYYGYGFQEEECNSEQDLPYRPTSTD